jgi:hypothetical protein
MARVPKTDSGLIQPHPDNRRAFNLAQLHTRARISRLRRHLIQRPQQRSVIAYMMERGNFNPLLSMEWLIHTFPKILPESQLAETKVELRNLAEPFSVHLLKKLERFDTLFYDLQYIDRIEDCFGVIRRMELTRIDERLNQLLINGLVHKKLHQGLD